jgi:hypothetical protein
VALGLVPATAEEQAALAAIHKKRREEREAEYAATAVATIIAVSPALGAGADMGDQERSFSSWRSPASSDMPPVVPGSPRFPEDFRRVGSPGGAEQTPRLPSHHLKIAGKSLGESRVNRSGRDKSSPAMFRVGSRATMLPIIIEIDPFELHCPPRIVGVARAQGHSTGQ